MRLARAWTIVLGGKIVLFAAEAQLEDVSRDRPSSLLVLTQGPERNRQSSLGYPIGRSSNRRHHMYRRLH